MEFLFEFGEKCKYWICIVLEDFVYSDYFEDVFFKMFKYNVEYKRCFRV